jgi:ADP-ribosylglycohydrolase
MLKEIAIADAYGAGFEFASFDKIKSKNNLSQYHHHDLYGMCGKYTDDAQMSIAIAELLVEQNNYNIDMVADYIFKCFRRDIRKGYSSGFYDLLVEVKSGKELRERIHSDSTRNGAAIRALPIGFIGDKNKVINFAIIQSKLTHNSTAGINSSCAVALAAYFALHLNGKVSNLKSSLESEQYGQWNYNWLGEVSVNAFDTVSAALTAVINHDSLADLLKFCIDYSGDTDSVASIAVGLASCFYNIRKIYLKICLGH